jgi:paraquat-inducible protein B
LSERTSSVLVGAFVVGALVIAVAAGLFFAGGGVGRDKTKVVMVFAGSLRGLTIGAPIALRGVTIGQVTEIDLLLDAEHGEVTMAVVGEIDPTTMRVGGRTSRKLEDELVSRGLRAQLNPQSLLTGLLYVQLDFRPETEAEFADVPVDYPQIPTIPTELEQLRRSLETIDYNAIAVNLDRIASGLDKLLNNPEMQALPASLRSSLDSIGEAGTALNNTLVSSGPALARLLDDTSGLVDDLGAEIPRIGARIDATLERFDSALATTTASLERIEDAAAPDSAPRRQLSTALQELSLAARALRSLARSLEEHPEALLRGRQETSQ